MSWRTGGALSVFLSLAAAGCAGSPEALAPTPSKEPLTDEDLGFDDTTGALQGHVYSEELVPIVGAQAAIRGSEFLDRTDEAGLYQFTNVPPGEYIVDVAALGYESGAKGALVEAGRVTDLDLRMRPIIIDDEVYPETIHNAGYLECALGGYAFVAPCTYPYRLVYGTAHNNGVNLSQNGAPPDLHPNKFWINITIKPKAGQLVAELVWNPSSAAAQRMNLFILCGDFDPTLNECTERIRYGNANGVSGTSPVRHVIEGEEFTKKGCPSSKFCLKDRPIWIANDVAMPFSNPQVAFQQRFEVWDTVFYNGPGPDGFTVLPDSG